VRDKTSLRIIVALMIPLSTALAEEPKFSAEDVLRGVVTSQETCSGSGMVWVEVDSKGDCMRFYAGQAASLAQPLIYVEGDVVRQSQPQTNPPTWEVLEYYSRLSPAMVQLEADQYSAAAARTFVFLARPGVYGSSGNHLQRRREREIALVDKAIDLLKTRFGWSTIDLSGLSGGGHLVAALMARRNDIGCAVIGSGNVAVRQRLREFGLSKDVTGYADFFDPIDHVDAVALHPPRKVIMLTDPKDMIVSAKSQGAYASALRAAGVTVEHRFVSALDDPAHHYLRTPTIMAAFACH
jgi:dienelactone hydrolase